jgi:hypothetical protein
MAVLMILAESGLHFNVRVACGRCCPRGAVAFLAASLR